jgi:hypothetical protein
VVTCILIDAGQTGWLGSPISTDDANTDDANDGAYANTDGASDDHDAMPDGKPCVVVDASTARNA